MICETCNGTGGQEVREGPNKWLEACDDCDGTGRVCGDCYIPLPLNHPKDSDYCEDCDPPPEDKVWR